MERRSHSGLWVSTLSKESHFVGTDWNIFVLLKATKGNTRYEPKGIFFSVRFFMPTSRRKYGCIPS